MKTVPICKTPLRDTGFGGIQDAEGNRLVVGDKQNRIGSVAELVRRANLHDELVAALRVFVGKYNAAPDGELGIGLVNGDFLKARDVLAKAECR